MSPSTYTLYSITRYSKKSTFLIFFFHDANLDMRYAVLLRSKTFLNGWRNNHIEIVNGVELNGSNISEGSWSRSNSTLRQPLYYKEEQLAKPERGVRIAPIGSNVSEDQG